MMAAVINVALSHAFVGKMPAPVSDPNLEVTGEGEGGGQSSRPLDKLGRSPKMFFCPIGP